MQLYGVTIVGERRLATVKVGSRFAQLAPAGRSFVTLGEGQAAGEFIVRQVAADQLVLEAAGARQVLHFTRKSDRSGSAGAVASAVPPPVQAAIEPPAPAVQTTSSSGVAHMAGQAAAAAHSLGATAPLNQSPQTGVAPVAEPAAVNSSPNPGPAVSLLDALAAARAQAAQNPNQGSAIPGNPFGSSTPPLARPAR